MILTGIADEAGNDIQTQIKAHQQIGWNAVELRTINGKNVCGELDDDAFDHVVAKLQEAQMTVAGFGSAIGNWSRHIHDDFQQDVDELKRAIPRMARLGVKHMRTMSWLGKGVSEKDWRDETIRRYRELAKMAEDGGVILAHENCTGWACQTPAHMRELIETVDSPAVRILLDIGNIVGYGFSREEIYQTVKPYICYIHIKDCRFAGEEGDYQLSENFTYPGEGDAPLVDIITDQLRSGYDGVLAIEPHVAKIIHDASVKPSGEQMFDSYIKYARQAIELVQRCRG